MSKKFKMTMPMLTLIISIVSPPTVGAGIIYWLNNEFTPKVQGGYLTVNEYKLAGAESNVQQLQTEIDSLQWDIDNGQATDKDKWTIQQKKKQLLEWKEKISKLQQGRVII